MRWNKSIKRDCNCPGVPLSLADAARLIQKYVTVNNEQRLHTAIGYMTPLAMIEGRRHQVHAAGDRTLNTARHRRRQTSLKQTQWPLLPQMRRGLGR